VGVCEGAVHLIEKYLSLNHYPVLKPRPKLIIRGKMKRTHQLIKLKAETVQDLKRLMAQTGTASLDELINSMIHLTDAHRLGLKEVGWIQR
jgi:hypothetical protein